MLQVLLVCVALHLPARDALARHADGGLPVCPLCIACVSTSFGDCHTSLTFARQPVPVACSCLIWPWQLPAAALPLLRTDS